jgi:hypothetical protein
MPIWAGTKVGLEHDLAAANDAAQHWPTMQGFKIAHGRLGKHRTAPVRVSQPF